MRKIGIGDFSDVDMIKELKRCLKRREYQFKIKRNKNRKKFIIIMSRIRVNKRNH